MGSAAAATRHLTFGDQVARVAGEAVREQQQLVVGDPLLAFLDCLDLVRREGPAQATRVEAGLFDRNDQGRITFNDLKRMARELGENMTDDELQQMFDKGDIDGNGYVEEEEFVRMMQWRR